MYLCEFGQNPSTYSKDNAQKQSYADRTLTEKQYVPPTPLVGWFGDIIIETQVVYCKFLFIGQHINIQLYLQL